MFALLDNHVALKQPAKGSKKERNVRTSGGRGPKCTTREAGVKQKRDLGRLVETKTRQTEKSTDQNIIQNRGREQKH